MSVAYLQGTWQLLSFICNMILVQDSTFHLLIFLVKFPIIARMAAALLSLHNSDIYNSLYSDPVLVVVRLPAVVTR